LAKIRAMTPQFFSKMFDNERECVHFFKELRERHGLKCRSCQSKRMSWISTQDRWECLDCKAKTTIRSGTIMMHSKVPLSVWFNCIYMMLNTKKAVSAMDMQQRLGLKRYETTWVLMHKIRAAMGRQNKRTAALGGMIELDDAFFKVNKDTHDPHPELFRGGRGSKGQQQVLLAVESIERIGDKKRNDLQENTRAGRLRMAVVSDGKGQTMKYKVQGWVKANSVVKSDAYGGFNRVKDIVGEHTAKVIPPEQGHVVLPWVHMAISNAKRCFRGIYHSMSREYLQGYLDEFSYKFNSRFSKQRSIFELFDELCYGRLQTSE
jgi:hypothetical protein